MEDRLDVRQAEERGKQKARGDSQAAVTALAGRIMMVRDKLTEPLVHSQLLWDPFIKLQPACHINNYLNSDEL